MKSDSYDFVIRILENNGNYFVDINTLRSNTSPQYFKFKVPISDNKGDFKVDFKELYSYDGKRYDDLVKLSKRNKELLGILEKEVLVELDFVNFDSSENILINIPNKWSIKKYKKDHKHSKGRLLNHKSNWI